MAKRFTDTEIWEQDWFIELPDKYKLLWFYIKDKCDNAGFWRPNKSTFQKITGNSVTLEDFLSFANSDKERIKILPTGRWFIKEYFTFQYGDKFSPTSQVHKGALKTLVQNGVHIKEILPEGTGNLQNINIQELKEIAYSKDIDSLNIAYGNPSKRVKDKDKVMDKDILGKGGTGEKPKGVKFDDSFENVLLSDDTWQALGVEQKILAKSGDIKPATIIKNSIY